MFFEDFGTPRRECPSGKKLIRCNRLCFCFGQGIDVVCGTISLFHECREWCPQNIPNYRVVYLRVPLEVLVERDAKQIYARALKGELDNVVGMDIAAEFHKEPDLIIDNDGSMSPTEVVDRILNHLSVPR